MSTDRPEQLPAKVAAALERIARAQRSERQAAATRHGLTPLQVDLLTVLADGTPPEPTVGLLAAEVAVTQPTATDSLRALTDKGLVERRPDPADGRRTTITLTHDGRHLTDELDQTTDELTAAIGALSPSVQAATLETLLTLIARLVDNGTIDVARTCFTCRYHRDDGDTHHCTLLQVDLPTPELRVNCPDHQAA